MRGVEGEQFATGLGNPAQFVVLRIAPVGAGQTVSGVLFLARHFPLVPGDELAVFVVVEAGYEGACGTHARGFCSNDLSPDSGRAFPFRLPEKVQAAFQSHKTVQKQPAHSKQAVAPHKPRTKPSILMLGVRETHAYGFRFSGSLKTFL